MTEGDELRIRLLNASDIRAVQAIDFECFAPTEQYEPGLYRTFLKKPFHALVAVLDANIAGWMLLHESESEIRIRSIATRKAFRGRGIATTLLRAAIACAGARTLDLLVERGNAEALRVYQSAGFVELGRDRDLPDRIRLVYAPAE